MIILLTKSSSGKNVIFTYAPYGIKTDNLYNVIIDNDTVKGIYSYTDNNFEKLKDTLSQKKLLSDSEKESIISTVRKEKRNLHQLNIRESGYQYKDNKILFYVLYDYSVNDNFSSSDIIYFEI